jgi:tetratricopeptide (TPR) repeat protein
VAGLEAKVLATSRERLNVAAEQEYPVPTLPLEDGVVLFTERARQRQPRFEPDENVTELARRLDGLPLAIELAAARVKVLTPAQIVERLGESLDLLSGGGRDRPKRHRTLRATLEWSHNLLTDDERKLFSRLGIFASSFDLGMAGAVAEADLDALQSLLDKSLLTPTGDDRFAMLDTVRTFAREQLDADELATLRHRQLQLLEPIAERSPAQLNVAAVSAEEQVAWFDEFERLLPDIRDVLAWALARDPARVGLVISLLIPGFIVRGGAHESRTWLERLLRQRSALPDGVLAQALGDLGNERRHEGDLEAAAALLHESTELFRRLGNRRGMGWAATGYAHTLAARGAYADALALYERTLAEFSDDQGMVAGTLNFIGHTLLQLGDFDRARETLLQAMAAAESSGDLTGHMLQSLGDLELEQRNLDDAETLYARARDIAREFKAWLDVAYCLAGLACVAALRGDTEGAGQSWGRVKRIEDETGDHLQGWDRERYERILEPLTNETAFLRGYEDGQAAPIDSSPSAVVSP